MLQDLHIGQSILVSCTSNINFVDKTTCVLMALAIDGVVPRCRLFGVLEWISSYHALQGLQS